MSTLQDTIGAALDDPRALSADSIREYVRQAGLVNLWFFCKFIAGAAGPFDFLNESVHLELANFRQSDACMEPGASACIVLPRGFAKTTICTMGASAWEALRDPNIRARIVNAKIERAHQFKNTAQRIFDSNRLFTWLYPEAVPAKNAPRWTSQEFVLPNATRSYKEPTVAAGGSQGASEGDHHDLLIGDDLVGLEDVDENFNPHQTMKAVRSWMDTNLTTLLVSPMTSRRILVFTRYGPGDVYSPMFADCKAIYGYVKELRITTHPANTWSIYYRHVIENGEATNPFVMTVPVYEKLLKEKPLVAAYQYANNVDMSVNNEFGQLATGLVSLEPTDEFNTDFRLFRADSENPALDPLLSQCNTCLSVDWAGTHRNVNAKTSRTSVGFWARDEADRYYRLAQAVGYFPVDLTFEKIFELLKKFEGFVGAVLLEPNAMQVGLIQLFKAECARRRIYIRVKEMPARGDKVVRIRTLIAHHLAAGRVYLAPDCSREFTEERMVFPSVGTGHLDVLDESSKAFEFLKRPQDGVQAARRRAQVEAEEYEVDNQVFGY